ncbi:MAG: catechol 2,3-dioxygenase-like lactoylglutathione lyase family enzyme [Planctomycetota bacterium]|jgi:catechol 2,3-dioxygenase-like lactoylglutathione lyase family enzyme
MSTETRPRKAHAVGINHLALEVGDIDQALDFYAQFIVFDIHARSEDMAFIYFGDQFINFTVNNNRLADVDRHFGIAVDDYELAKQTLIDMDVNFLEGPFLDFLDPWGNRVEITTYVDIQFSKTKEVLQGMGLGHLKKSDLALSELKAKGMAPED